MLQDLPVQSHPTSRRAATRLMMVALVLPTLTSCGAGDAPLTRTDQQPVAPTPNVSTPRPDSSSTPGSDPTPTAASSPTSPPKITPVVTLADCYNTNYDDLPTFTIRDLRSPGAEFEKIWRKKIADCDTVKRTKGPLEKLEQRGLATSRYKAKDVTYLYLFCAQNDRHDYFTKKSATPTAEQAAEIKGWLVVCPHHPNAKAWKAAMRRGEKQATLENSGRSFSDGTYRVGKEVKPGTYAIKGAIENCYWERQNRSGHTIDNYFTAHARRVEVTIRPGDYAFSTEGCGLWKPAG